MDTFNGPQRKQSISDRMWPLSGLACPSLSRKQGTSGRSECRGGLGGWVLPRENLSRRHLFANFSKGGEMTAVRFPFAALLSGSLSRVCSILHTLPAMAVAALLDWHKKRGEGENPAPADANQ